MGTTTTQTAADKKLGRIGAGASSRVVTEELKKLLQHSSHYLSGILISLALGFISFPLFTRAFSVADYGTIELVAKVLLLLTALSKMGLQQSALRFYDGRALSSDPRSARRYYSTMFGGAAFTATLMTVVFLFSVELAPKSLLNSSLRALLFLVSTLIVVRALTSVLWVFLRVQEKTKLYSVFTVAIKIATVIAICLFMWWLGRSVRAFYSGTIVVESAVMIILAMILLKGGLLRLKDFDVAFFWSGLAFGLPLICYELAGITLDAGDRVLVRHYLGADALGHYSVAYGMADYVNNLLIVPINLALTPIYIRLWTLEGQERTSEFLGKGLDLFLMVGIGVFVVAATTSHYAVILLASSKYLGAEVLVPMIVAGLLIYTSSAFIGAGLMIHKNTGVMARVLAYSAILNIVLNCLLLPRLGLFAAALTTLLSYSFCVLLLARASHKVLPLILDPRAIGKYALAGAIAWYAASHLEVGSVIASLAGRVALTSGIYAGLLYVMDSRLRALLGDLISKRPKSVGLAEEELVTTSGRET